MAVTRIENTDLLNVRAISSMKEMSLTVDAGAAEFVIPQGSPPVIYLDPGGGAIDCLLPLEADNVDVKLTIFNDASTTEIITLKDSADAGLTPAMTFTQNEVAIMHCDGTTWRGFVGVV